MRSGFQPSLQTAQQLAKAPQPMNLNRLKQITAQTLPTDRLLPMIPVSLITSLVEATAGISYATLMFSGSLSPYISIGISMMLLTAIVTRTLLGFTSTLRGVLAQVNESGVVILALLAQTLQKTLTNATAEEIWLTLLAAIVLSSVLSGAFLMVLGWLKLAQLIRFIPYPVVGGFLAGMGWLLVQGGIQVIADVPLGWFHLLTLFQPDRLVRWLPGLALAIWLLLASRRSQHPFLLPISLLAATGLFFLGVSISHTPIADLRTQGWLLNRFSTGQFVWQSVRLSDLGKIQWAALWQHMVSIGAIVLVNAIDVLLSVSALELVTQRDVNLNREMQATGIVNIGSGLVGGLSSCHSVFDSSLAYEFGANRRSLSLVSAAFIGFLFFHLPLLSYIPKPVLGGLLIFLGLSFLTEWLYDAWFKLTRSDYLIIVLILLVVMALGLLVGIGVGITIAILFFVINYSRVRAVRHCSSGSIYQSRIIRPVHQTRLLREQGNQIYILELQGFLFFGNTNSFVQMVRQRLAEETPQGTPLKFVLLDFRLVSGLDASAAMSVTKLRHNGSARTVSAHSDRSQPDSAKPAPSKRLPHSG